MNKICFLKDTGKFVLPECEKGKDIVVTYRNGFNYNLPQIENAQYIEFEKFKCMYNDINADCIVFVGLNRIITPSNRCEYVFEYLFSNTPNISKYSIDTAPFIGEPWRLWFHFGIGYGKWLGTTYSFFVETDWKHWFERDNDDSIISAESIEKEITGVASDIDELAFYADFYEPDKELTNFYKDVKQIAFEKYSTPKNIILFLLKELNKHIDLDFDFDTYRDTKKISLPNLGIYRFIYEENIRRMKIYNTIALCR